MVLACLTHFSDRLRCGIDVVGISNFVTFLKNTQDYRRDLAMSHNNLACLLPELGKQPEAEKQHRKALAIQEKLVAEFPAVPAYREDLAMNGSRHYIRSALLMIWMTH